MKKELEKRGGCIGENDENTMKNTGKMAGNKLFERSFWEKGKERKGLHNIQMRCIIMRNQKKGDFRKRAGILEDKDRRE